MQHKSVPMTELSSTSASTQGRALCQQSGNAVGYMTDGVTSEEITSWQRLAAKYGRATYVHGRDSSQRPPATGVLGFEGVLSNSAIFGNGVYFCHMHQQALSGTVHALELFDTARKNAMKVIGELYPYN